MKSVYFVNMLYWVKQFNLDIMAIDSDKTPSFHKFFLIFILTVSLLVGCSSNSNTDEDKVEEVQDKVEVPAPLDSTLSQDSSVPVKEGIEASNETQVTLEEPVTPEVKAYQPGIFAAFDQVAFDEALADNQKILLGFHADWCHVCKANEPIIVSGLENSDVVAFRINYDTAQDLKSQYGVTLQSTYIFLEGEKEVERKTGVLNETSFSELINI